MYKNTSDNAVRRERNSVILNRNNNTSIDFEKKENDLNDERLFLVGEKKIVEARCAKIIGDIQHHYRTSGRTKSITGEKSILKWEADRRLLLQKKNEIEARLAQIKAERNRIKIRRPLAFVEAFYRIAKRTLPDEVIIRISDAALALMTHEDYTEK